MFEKLEAHQEKAMAHEGSLKCEYKSYFFPELSSLSVEELEQKEGQKSSYNVTNRQESSRIVTNLRAKSYIYPRRVSP